MKLDDILRQGDLGDDEEATIYVERLGQCMLRQSS